MIDFGEEEGVAGHEGLYQHGLQDEEREGEPEARKVQLLLFMASPFPSLWHQQPVRALRDSRVRGINLWLWCPEWPLD